MSDPIARLNAALEGRYAIERELGEGGMATVYLADDLKHQRKVALKVLKPELAAVVGAERFLAEITTTANLTHPHILPLHDSGEADSYVFYVMPYVEGESLRDKLDREHQLPVDDAVRIASDVAEALDYAHSHGVIHRDIKPANILIQAGRPVIADFGIALAISAGGADRLTETGLSVGTPHYMSPEQATGDQTTGPATDTYAFGCVVYEMLVGEPPYTGSTAQAILGKIIAGELASATKERASVPANVDAAIRKALEKLPADRFSSAQDFSRALADSGFRHGEEPAVVVGGRRQWTPLAMVSTGLAVLLVMNLGWTLLRPDPQRLAARFEFVGPDPGATVGNAGSVLDVSSDGSRFVFLGSGPTGGQLWHRPLDQLVSLPIPGTAGARSPRFSPDGESVVFRIGDRLLTVSLTGGAPSTAVSEGVDGVGSAWGPDGMLYFFVDGDLWRMPAAGGEQEQITSRQSSAAPYAWPDVLPNGKGILLIRLIGGLASREIGVLSLETNEVRVLLQGVMARYAASGHIVYASADGRLLAAPFDADRLEITGPSQALAENIQMNPVGGSVFALSETGVLLYRTVDSQTEYSLQVAPFDGAAESIPLPAQDFADPRWSPDGRSLAYSSGPVGAENIYVYDVELGTAPRQLTFEGSNVDPVWSQDGSHVVFASVRGEASDYDLFVKAVNEDTFEERILQLEAAQFPRQWLTNDMVIFESGFRSVSGLWQVSAAGGDATLYIESESDFDDVAVSPDGRWAVYQSDETGAEELYVRSFPQARQQVRVSEAGRGGQFPRWSPDGSLIYYWSAEGLAIDTLYAATVLTEPTFTVLSREVVHTGDYAEENWDLHPDGDRIVAAQPSSPTTFRTDHLFVVLNIFEELRQVVPH